MTDDECNYTSPLGTLEYWNEAYIKEKNIYNVNKEDEGQIWFGKALQKKIVSYIDNNYKDKSISILDIGFGNGVLLYKLAKKQYTNLYGIDYAESSVPLAQQIIEEKGKKHNTKYNINFIVEDINNKTGKIDIKFDLIHDKGSMDAYLMNKSNTIDNYYSYLKSYSKIGYTIFIISSINNTKLELMDKFSENKGFKFLDEIKSPSLTFGGHTGDQYVTHIYKIIS